VLAKKAVQFDPNDGLSEIALGDVCLERRKLDEATFHIQRALTLNPSDPVSAIYMGELLAYSGQPDQGISWMDKAFRLNPYAPQWYHSAHVMVLFCARRYAEAIAASARITRGLPPWNSVYVIASCGHLGQPEEAQAAIASYQAAQPGISLLQHASHEPFKNQFDLDHLLGGLRKAGLAD